MHDAATKYLTRLIDNVERYQVEESLDSDVSQEDVDRICYLIWNADTYISATTLMRAQTYEYR